MDDQSLCVVRAANYAATLSHPGDYDAEREDKNAFESICARVRDSKCELNEVLALIGQTPDETLRRCDADGNTLLHLLADRGEGDAPDIAAALIERGLDIYARNVRGQTVLHTAAVVNNRSLYDFYCEARVSEEARDIQGNIPAKLLRDAGRNKRRKTPVASMPPEVVAAALCPAKMHVTDQRDGSPSAAARGEPCASRQRSREEDVMQLKWKWRIWARLPPSMRKNPGRLLAEKMALQVMEMAQGPQVSTLFGTLSRELANVFRQVRIMKLDEALISLCSARLGAGFEPMLVEALETPYEERMQQALDDALDSVAHRCAAQPWTSASEFERILPGIGAELQEKLNPIKQPQLNEDLNLALTRELLKLLIAHEQDIAENIDAFRAFLKDPRKRARHGCRLLNDALDRNDRKAVELMILADLVDSAYNAPGCGRAQLWRIGGSGSARTALHLMAGNPEDHALFLAHALIKKGANIDAVDDCGRTPLHEAARSGSVAMVRLLLKCGANDFIRDDDGVPAVKLIARMPGMLTYYTGGLLFDMCVTSMRRISGALHNVAQGLGRTVAEMVRTFPRMLRRIARALPGAMPAFAARRHRLALEAPAPRPVRPNAASRARRGPAAPRVRAEQRR
jgi:ankyrin repeat protein